MGDGTRLVYIDTSIYISLFAGKDNILERTSDWKIKDDEKKHIKALKIMSELGDRIIVVSDLIFIEVLTTFRKTFSVLSEKEFETKAQTNYHNIIGKMLQSPKYRFKTQDMILANMLRNSLNILQKATGNVTTYKRCDMCNNPNPISYPAYKSINTNDLFHLLIAKENKCEEFFTFDKGFNDVKDYDEFSAMKIVVL